MDAQETDIIETLDRIVRQPQVAQVLESAICQGQAQLAQAPGTVSASIPIPLSTYGEQLTQTIQSSRIFILRARSTSGIERHPNSHQRVLSYRGSGEILTLEGEKWRSHAITSEPGMEVGKRWSSVPEGIWHQPIAGESDWAVVVFHTASQDELVDEYEV
jgi:hypothetical protein